MLVSIHEKGLYHDLIQAYADGELEIQTLQEYFDSGRLGDLVKERRESNERPEVTIGQACDEAEPVNASETLLGIN